MVLKGYGSILHSILFVLFKGIEKECRVIRDYYWRNRLQDLFETKVLSAGSAGSRSAGNDSTMQSLLVLSPSVFQANE